MSLERTWNPFINRQARLSNFLACSISLRVILDRSHMDLNMPPLSYSARGVSKS